MERGKEGLREEKGEMTKTKGHTRTCMETQHSRRFLKYSPTQRRSEWGHQIAGKVEPQLDQRKHLGGAVGGETIISVHCIASDHDTGPSYHAALREAVDISLHDVQVLLDVHEVLGCLVDAGRARVLDATNQPHGLTHGVPRAQNPLEVTGFCFWFPVIHFKWLHFSKFNTSDH